MKACTLNIVEAARREAAERWPEGLAITRELNQVERPRP
jgi:hypothetical protein